MPTGPTKDPTTVDGTAVAVERISRAVESFIFFKVKVNGWWYDVGYLWDERELVEASRLLGFVWRGLDMTGDLSIFRVKISAFLRNSTSQVKLSQEARRAAFYAFVEKYQLTWRHLMRPLRQAGQEQ